jgi:uncharacterized Ntn-hydrolase superfamily protein
MSETTEFIIGSAVSCTDGACGELRHVVVGLICPRAQADLGEVAQDGHGPVAVGHDLVDVVGAGQGQGLLGYSLAGVAEEDFGFAA